MAERPDRFYSLDVLRGLASLGIVFWHWQNFFDFGSRLKAPVAASLQPLYVVFAPLYQAGYLAVDLFFALSGFIFFALYAERIRKVQVSGKKFFILRFSRLYPLHLATLLFVLAGQTVYSRITGSYFHYSCNDAYHFILNLFFVSSWGFEKDHSFNGPFWSVSVEALLYIIFFVFCRFRRISMIGTLAMAAAGVAISFVNLNIGHGVLMFYLGGAAFQLYDRRSPDLRPKPLLILVAVMWCLPIALARIPAVAGLHAFTWGAAMYMRLAVFPATIYVLAIFESRRGTLGKQFALLGDVSYSTYLLHFPLQLVLAIIAASLGLGFEIFLSPYVLAFFFAALLSAAYVSHRYLEIPAQDFLREHWLRRSINSKSPASDSSTTAS